MTRTSTVVKHTIGNGFQIIKRLSEVYLRTGESSVHHSEHTKGLSELYLRTSESMFTSLQNTKRTLEQIKISEPIIVMCHKSYKSNDQYYMWRSYFLAGLLDRSPVNSPVSMEGVGGRLV